MQEHLQTIYKLTYAYIISLLDSFFIQSYLKPYGSFFFIKNNDGIYNCLQVIISIGYRLISPVGRVFANSPWDLNSIPDRVIPKTLKMVIDTSLINTQQYKVRINGQVGQSREMSCTFPYTLVY